MNNPSRLDEPILAVEEQLSIFWRRGRAILSRLAAQVHPDVDPTTYALLSVIRREGSMRLTDLATQLGVGKPSMSRQVSLLEQLGFIIKTADPADGRAQQIALTDSGEEVMHRVQDARREVFRKHLGAWEESDLEALVTGLTRLNDMYAKDLAGPR